MSAPEICSLSTGSGVASPFGNPNPMWTPRSRADRTLALRPTVPDPVERPTRARAAGRAGCHHGGMGADVVIRGGTVIDGTGSPGQVADVAISDGRIAAIGPGLSGARVLDASGQIVAPGFIDIHTHYDAQVFWDPSLTPSSFHGVTTVVAGNCGFSIAPVLPEGVALLARTLQHVEDMSFDTLSVGVPWDEFETFPQYLDAIARRGTALNFTCYVGHTAVRMYVMGEEAYTRAATPDEIARMQS